MHLMWEPEELFMGEAPVMLQALYKSVGCPQGFWISRVQCIYARGMECTTGREGKWVFEWGLLHEAPIDSVTIFVG